MRVSTHFLSFPVDPRLTCKMPIYLHNILPQINHIRAKCTPEPHPNSRLKYSGVSFHQCHMIRRLKASLYCIKTLAPCILLSVVCNTDVSNLVVNQQSIMHQIRPQSVMNLVSYTCFQLPSTYLPTHSHKITKLNKQYCKDQKLFILHIAVI